MTEAKFQHVAVDLVDGRTVMMHIVVDDEGELLEPVEHIIAKAGLAYTAWRLITAEEAAQISAALRRKEA